jgi:hypothetical protein
LALLQFDLGSCLNPGEIRYRTKASPRFFAAAFKIGGLHLNSSDPVNTVGSVLTRRANEVGDIVKIGRGTWGLKEWYPNRSFKKGKAADEKPEDDDLSDIL